MSGSTNDAAPGALAGIRVLDFTRFQQGPFATLLLADMGADVVKVEQPGGEPARGIGLHQDGYSSYFESLNRNKRSICIDLGKPEGRALAVRMAAASDILVQNFAPGTMERLGLDYEMLSRLNPGLIYASGSAFGPEGPRANHVGYDTIAQAAGGIMAWSRRGDEMPRNLQSGLADQTSGVFLAVGILGALAHRLRTGEGQQVDGSLFGSQIALQGIHYARDLHHAPLMPPGKASGVLTHVALCEDGRWITFGILEGRHFPRMSQGLDLPELAEDPRFATAAARGANMGELVELLDAQVIQRPSSEWIDKLSAMEISCSVVQDYEMVAADPQARANAYVHVEDHPRWGRIHTHGLPNRLSRTPATIRTHAPEQPGEDTRVILADFGLTEAEIAALQASGALPALETAPTR